MTETRSMLEGVGLCIEQTPPQPVARLLLAHGAGAPMDSAFMDQICERLVARGVACVRFEFPYMFRRRTLSKRSPPDPAAVLLVSWDAVVGHYKDQALPLFIGGKSMGGRMATLWATQRAGPCEGVVCFGYPFHPARRPERLRVAHLPELPIPALIVQGARDPMGSLDEVTGYELGAKLKLHWIDGGDHDLRPLKKTGITHAQALEHAAQAAVSFILETIAESLALKRETQLAE